MGRKCKIENVILFGVGAHILKAINLVLQSGEKIIALVDNDVNKVGTLFQGYEIQEPGVIKKLNYDRILICTPKYFDEIYKQLMTQFNVQPNKISDTTHYSRINLINYYEENKQEVTQEMLVPLQYVKRNNQLNVFNYEFSHKYDSMKIDVFFDNEKSLFYVNYLEKRMYMKKSFSKKESIERYVRGILLEQDEESPHKYLDADFDVREGDIVLDVGVAEGNFSLQIIDRVKHLYLVETDEQWVEALQCTFESYKDKVTIINKFLSNESGADSITIDEIAQETDIDFIKMDIEGAEEDALQGGSAYLKKKKNQKIAVCAYHNVNDEKKISSILGQCGYSLTTTPGYMVFLATTIEPKKFVRGIVRGQK